jgi:hypothetical protein
MIPRLRCWLRFGCAARLATDPREKSQVGDALVCADVTSAPTGLSMGLSMAVRDLLADVHSRHVAEDPAPLPCQLVRTTPLLAAVNRLEASHGSAGRR